jgi:flavin reductase (DIM6/NTAB) family NADH-FMN oxidoreductase RutF
MASGPPDSFGSPYRLLSSAVVPRPIAWVSSRGPDGTDNLAPYSFFNVVAVDPPVLMFAPVGRADAGGVKDTARNVLGPEGVHEDGSLTVGAGTREFVVHVVTEDTVEAMNATSATLDHEESEFDHAGLTPVEAAHVDAARVEESAVAFECTLYDAHGVGGSTMILGEVVHAHVADDLLVDGKLDVERLDAVGRLAGGWYARLSDRFELERPP